jgi:dTDP-glucose 4,6-dehydratase
LNVLITGCAGFIGSHAVEGFLEEEHTVVGVDCLTYAGTLSNMSTFIEDITFYKEDIANQSKMMKIVSKHNIDWIINFAAESHVDNSINSAGRFLHSNINGVHSLLEVCRKLECKLFQISTDEVYGSIKEGAFVETDKLNPRNPYSATKAAAEHLITSYYNTHAQDYKMVRMSNNFGPRQNKEKFIPTILRSLSEGKKIPIYGDGRNIRDWFYVKDCVKCIIEVFNNGNVNEVYNLSLVNEKENLEVVSMLLGILEKPFHENVEFIKDRPGHDFRYSISNDKLAELSEIKPTDFEKSLKQTIGYYKNNE